MKIVNYINLTAGLLQKRYKGTKIKIQSSHIESHAFDRLFYGLSDDLLYNLAIGNKCRIIDCSSNPVGKVIKHGIPLIKCVINKLWFGNVEYKDHPFDSEYLERVYMSLSRATKRKIKYYKRFINFNFFWTDKNIGVSTSNWSIRLEGQSVKVGKEILIWK